MENYESFVGKTLDDRYRINSIVGSGGMAVVFEAYDSLMNRPVAIKMLKFDVRQDEQAVKRFINESKVVAMLNHPNLISIYDVSIENENKYIVMEYIDGITLKEYIATMGKIEWQEAISYTQQVLAGLQHAHEKQVIHRDVKPQNIILLRSGEIKVADFGIARLPNHETLTLTDKAIGTVHYISPEQASKESIDHKSDIYSVGVMLYEMTTGCLPFTAENPIQIAMMHVNDTPRNPRAINRDLPKGIAQIILKAMSKNPDMRYKSANSMIKHLGMLLENPECVFTTSPSAIAQTSADMTQVVNSVDVNRFGDVPVDREKEADKKPQLSKKLNVKRGLRKNHSLSPIVIGVTLAFLIVLAVAGSNLVMKFLNYNEADSSLDVLIPDVRGGIYEEGGELEDELALQRIKILTVEYVNNNNYPPNTIISQDPQPKEVKKLTGSGMKIDMKLVVSQGKHVIELEEYTIMDARQVQFSLEKYDLIVELIHEEHDTIESGYVINTEPAAGTEVKSGDLIKVHVSSGQKVKYIIMPTLVTLTEEKAKQVISSSKLILAGVTYDEKSDKPFGTVTSQNILSGTSVPENSTKVKITVSAKKDEPAE